MSKPARLPGLRTPRLTLRPLRNTDTSAIIAGADNFDVSKWLSVVPYPYKRADAKKFLDRVADGRQRVWAICDDAGLKGVIGTEDELGYWLARPDWGRGYAFEAAQAVVAHWFSDPNARPLEAGVFDGNDQSGAILSALGFQVTGRALRAARTLSQKVSYSRLVLTRPRWEARQDFTLHTRRLTLRPALPDDAAAFAALSVIDVARNLANIPTGMSVEDARKSLEHRAWRGLPGFSLMIEQEGTVIGWVGFGGSPLSLGFALDPGHWGQGLMTEALTAFLPELFDRFPISRIAADHFDDNPASGAILTGLGFRKTGEATATSLARLEPCRAITYAVTRDSLKVRP